MERSIDTIRVAVLGPAGVGKSTLARRCQQAWGGKVLSFAAPLKAITTDLFGERMGDPAFARTVNQELGVWARTHDEDVWVRQLTSRVSASAPTYVDDCRFLNEAVALRDLGFVFVRLVCSNETLAERRPAMTSEQRSHASEVEAATLAADIIINTDRNSVDEAFAAVANYLATTNAIFAPVMDMSRGTYVVGYEWRTRS